MRRQCPPGQFAHRLAQGFGTFEFGGKCGIGGNFSTDCKRVSRIKLTIQIGMNQQNVVFEG
jgi:hypothetical protein